jgi:hypothetical protein
MQIRIILLSVVSIVVLIILLSTSNGCVKQKDDTQVNTNKAKDILALKGINDTTFNSLQCAFCYLGYTKNTWLNKDDNSEARELLLDMLSQPEADEQALKGVGVGWAYVEFCSSRDTEEGYIPKSCLIFFHVPTHSPGAYKIYLRSNVSEDFEMVKAVLPDEKTKDKLLALAEKARILRYTESKNN